MIVGAVSITIREKPDDLTVLGSNALVRWLNKRKPTLDDLAVKQVVAAASRAGTWSKLPVVPVDLGYLSTFAALREEVDRARVRRLGWTVLGMVVFVIGVFQLVPGWVSSALGS